MSLATFSVKRPIFTTMATLLVVILGIVSLSRLRIDLLPEIELPTVSVVTSYEGASPEVVERLVTQVLEEIISTVPGIEEITSQSSEGRSSIRVTFAWGTDIATAALDVQSTIEDQIRRLPEDALRPQVRKFDIASFPVVILGISSDLDPVEMTELIEDQIRYRFSRIPGVAQVDLWGGFNREVRVELDPERIKALELPLDQILSSIRAANLDRPAGRIDRGRLEITLRAPGEFESLDDIRTTVVAVRNGAAVTLGQISEVLDTYTKITRHVRVNGRRGVRIAIRKEADANTVEVSRRVLAEVDEINDSMPQVQIVPVIDQGDFIERSIRNVADSVLYGGSLAILVLLFFLRNIRSTIVISLAIPISIIATFALMYFGGFTLNLMTLGGLALGIGMLVDNSIVVLENIFRWRDEDKQQPREASIGASGEVASAIVASTITTLVVFLPMVFVRGVAGIMFRELAFVVMFSLICSLFVSLSLVPMLSSRLLESPDELHSSRPKWIDRIVVWSDNIFSSLEENYRTLLARVIRHPWITVFTAAAILGASLLLLPMIGTEFMPPSDEGEVRVNASMEVGTRLDIVDEQARKIEAIVTEHIPERDSYVISSGSGTWRTAGAPEARLRLSLAPARARQRSNVEIANDLRQRLRGQLPGMEVSTRAPQGQMMLNRLLAGEGGLQIEVRGFELPTLEALSQRVMEAIADVPGIADTDMSLQPRAPQQEIIIDRHKAADLGLSVQSVTSLLETAVAGTRVGEFRQRGDSYRILVQMRDADKLDIDEILDLTLRTNSGRQVALRNIVETRDGLGPVVIDRKDQQRIVTIDVNVTDRDLGSIAADVQERLRGIALPVGYDILLAGDYEEQQEAFQELLISLLLALLFVYMVLACQYESFVNPLVVMTSVPVAAVGVLLTLFLTDTTLNLQSYIGCIMLAGIVVNNAILLVDQAGRLARDGMDLSAAVAEAGRRRLRPILMTTLTTILALSPLAFGIGEGADAQAPLARAVIGGLSGSTLITLVLIPAVYILFHRKRGELS